MNDYPEPIEMTAEQSAMFFDPTDPDDCTCEHDGLPVPWHRTFCELYPKRGQR